MLRLQTFKAASWRFGVWFLLCFVAEKQALAQSRRQVHFVRPASTQRPWRSSSPNSDPRTFVQQQQEREYQSHFLDYNEARKDKRARGWRVDFKDRRIGKMSLTSKLIWLNVAAYALQAFRPSFTAWGVKRSDLILRGEQLYRLLTPVFLHGGIAHLGTNMYSLGRVGPDVEKLFGPGRYLCTYLLAGVAGNLMSAFQSPNPALGASGAVFGVIGAYTVFLSRNDWLLGNFGEAMNSRLMQTMMMNIGLGFINPSIDNWGHIGGALGGAVMAFYVGPRLYMTDLPGGGRMVVDRPLIRLPRSIERVPDRIGSLAERISRRVRIDRYLQDRPTPPWQQRQQRRKPAVPNRSIKPKKS